MVTEHASTYCTQAEGEYLEEYCAYYTTRIVIQRWSGCAEVLLEKSERSKFACLVRARGSLAARRRLHRLIVRPLFSA